MSLDQIVTRLRDTEGVVYQDEITREQESRPSGFVSDVVYHGTVQDLSPGAAAASERRRLTRFSWRAFAQIAMQVCEALRYAHHKKILHNDIKPGNVLLNAEGQVWITDFGLSASAQASASTEETLHPYGTLRYMAPERFAGSHDGRSDLYSLGMTLYEMLTLQPAFEADSEAELIRRIQQEPIVAPSALQPSVPRDLETIVLNCVAKRPEHRYQSAEALYSDLLLFGRGQRVRSTRPHRLSVLWNWWKPGSSPR